MIDGVRDKSCTDVSNIGLILHSANVTVFLHFIQQHAGQYFRHAVVAVLHTIIGLCV